MNAVRIHKYGGAVQLIYEDAPINAGNRRRRKNGFAGRNEHRLCRAVTGYGDQT